MKTLLFSGYDENMKELGDLTAPLMLAYASKHGMDFKCIRQKPKDLCIYWIGVYGSLEAFNNGYDRVIYMDCDQIVTNLDYCPIWESGFHASMDWGADAVDESCFSMCCFVAGKDSREIFQWALDHEKEWTDKPFPEQAPMQHQFRTIESSKKLMHIHPREIFNCVPIQVHESVVRPWQPGDWLCHLTMISVENRVKLFHEIRSRNEVA